MSFTESKTVEQIISGPLDSTFRFSPSTSRGAVAIADTNEVPLC
jgi:hypothetical protein